MKNILYVTIFLLSYTSNSQISYAVSEIPQELKKNANSVTLYENIDIDVSEPNLLVKKHQSAITVFNKLGDNDIQYYAYYDSDSKIKKIESFVYDAFGNEIHHFKKKNFKDVSATDGSLYQDDRVLYLNYTPTTYPYTFVFSYERQSNTTAFIPSWHPVRNTAQSVKNSRFILTFNPENKPRIKTLNLEAYNITVSDNPKQIICDAKSIEALVYEELSPSYNQYLPNISFALNHFSLKGVAGYASNWQEFGSWMQKTLLEDVGEIPEGTIQEIKNLTHNATNNQEKARIVYSYLQEKVRYISVQIGIGGWKPMLAKDVDRLSYGDCKALTNYTKVLLDAIDVPNYYTIIHAGAGRKARDITKDFTAMQGNHAILGVPDGKDIIWLECTSQDTPFGYMGDFTDDRDVLIITPEGGKIVHTKVYAYKDNTQDTQATVFINNEGSLKSSYNRIYKGQQYSDKHTFKLLTKEEIKKHYLNKWSYLNGYKLDKIEFTDNREDIIFTENLEISIPAYCSTLGDDLLLCPNVFNRNQYIPPRIIDRKRDLHISMGYFDTDEIEIKIPLGFNFDKLPENVTIENKFGVYSISFEEINQSTIKYKRVLYLKKDTYPPEEYVVYRDFLKKVAKLDKTKFLIKQNK